MNCSKEFWRRLRAISFGRHLIAVLQFICVTLISGWLGSTMERTYVEQREGGYWIRDTRISLDSIVEAFKRGAAPESINRSFPLLSLEEIYGAITFYLSHEQEIDSYLSQAESQLDSESEARSAQARAANPDLFDRLEGARQEPETTPRRRCVFRPTPISTKTSVRQE